MNKKGSCFLSAIIICFHLSCTIKLNNQYKIFLNNKLVLLHDEGNRIYSFNAKAGETYFIK